MNSLISIINEGRGENEGEVKAGERYGKHSVARCLYKIWKMENYKSEG